MENLSATKETLEGTTCTGGASEKVPMHPDDFAALLSWITAKRFHETGIGETYREKPVYFGIIG
ncbi:MAG: hypothetical protein ABSB80_01695 [Methanoregula sp.]|jgi:hypothetical protein|uniref:hypothetical protein n=1 Tax=Methanoregula sp. TaxID=2052170 RepID=UPI003D140F80